MSIDITTMDGSCKKAKIQRTITIRLWEIN